MRVPRASIATQENLIEEKRNINFYTKPSMFIDINEIISDEKTRAKYIKKVERVIRNSMEYKEYIKFLKEEIDMNSCLFYKDIDRNEMQNVRLEIHHEPFTLYDLCEIVMMKHINENEDIHPLVIAEEIMKLHFMGIVGLVPLSVTVHKLVHKGEIFVPMDKVYGNLKEFIERYQEGMSPDHFNILTKSIDMTIQMQDSKYNPEILERKAVYLNVRDMESVKKIELNEEQMA